MKIAVVDVGTNTTRLFIATVADGQIQAELARISRVTRLGAGVDASGRLADDALEREHVVLADYGQEMQAAEVDRRVAVMTSAVRDAANGGEFAADVTARYGLDVHVLSGDDEAQLTYAGATDDTAPDDARRTLVIDIGGGSTEMIIGTGRTPSFHVSTQAGVVRQADRHLHTDPPAGTELDALARDIRATLEAAVPAQERTGIQRAIAVAGTATSLAAIDMRLEPYDPERVHGFRLPRQSVARLYSRLRSVPLEERKAIRGLHPDRANAIVPGAIILAEVMELFSLPAVEVSEHDILRGAAVRFSGD